MKLKIEARGYPGSGKTTAIRVIEKALREQFNIVTIDIQDEQGRMAAVEIECELKR